MNLATSLAKTFRLTEKSAIHLRLDAFNTPNHVNFGNPVGNLSSALFGRSNSAQDPRQVQLGARFEF